MIIRRIKRTLLIALMTVCVAGCGTQKDTDQAPTATKDTPTVQSQASIMEEDESSSASVTEEPTPAETTDTPTPEPTESATDTPTPTPECTEPITISVVGDVFISPGLVINYDAYGIEGVVSQAVLDKMHAADFMIANHEYCCTDIDRSNAVPYQTYIEHQTTDREHIFAELGIDVAGLANNHGYDYGEQGLIDTMETLKSFDIPYVGAGMNSDESTDPLIIEKDGKKIAIFAANGVITHRDWISGPDKPGMNALWDLPYYDSYGLIIEKIKKAKEECDLVIAMPHFGDELAYDMNYVQKEYAHAYVDAGVDIVLGSHPHVLQGMEYYGDGVIFYSLSNFLFEAPVRETCIVTITLNPDNSYDINVFPCLAHYYRTDEVNDNSVFDLMNKHSINAKIEEDGTLVRTDS